MQQWEMNEIFTFPKQLGNVLAKSNIVVEPRWHEEIKDDSVMLRGIYVLKGNIQFDHVAREEVVEEGIYIEHIDIEKDYGYFEYALPFAIDFPNDQIEKIALRIDDVKIEPNNGCCLCSWQVHCDVEKKVQAVEEIVEIAQVSEPAEHVEQASLEQQELEEVQYQVQHEHEQEQETPQKALATEELDFLEQLADAYSRVQIQLKK